MQFPIIHSAIFLVAAQCILAAPTGTTLNMTISLDGLAPQFSPVFPNINVSLSHSIPFYNDGPLDTNTTLSNVTLDLSNYPVPWSKPDVNHPEVKAVIKQINWHLVPDYVPKTMLDYDLDQTHYDEEKDDTCWWTSTNCVKPKLTYLPQDYYTCPTKGDWGLSYDDGPLNMRTEYDGEDFEMENRFAEPRLYNFLAKENVTSTLFYIGSNVLTYPDAARRALFNGHTLCSHTWSHPAMTTQTNEQVVAELYWTLKVIKEATGVTPKCWRPPQGDVDDRIRSIAWQMGMSTVIWDRDTEDWAMPALGSGYYPPAMVDALFEKWIEEEEKNLTSSGIMVLEHELNHATISMTEKWIPILKKTFNVVSALTCNGVFQPYWETDFKYPNIYNLSSTEETNSTTTKVTQ